MKRNILIVSFLLLCLTSLTLSAETVIYLDLSLGGVSINGETKKFSGYVGVAGAAKQYSAVSFTPSETTFYIYQSSTVSGSPWTVANTGYENTTDFNNKQNIRLPQYEAMMCEGKPWADYITDNSSVEDVAENWETAAAAVKRSSSGRIIRINGGSGPFNIVLDNIWSSFCEKGYDSYGIRDGGISIKAKMPNDPETYIGRTTTSEKVTLKLKGDSRISNIYYTNDSAGTGYLHITSYDGDGADSGSLTVAYPHGSNISSQDRNNEAIIGCGNGPKQCGGCVYNLCFNGGTVFAGCQKINNQVYPSASVHPIIHVIGGRQHSGITVNGGRLTAVNSGTAAAIGGGGGYKNKGGKGHVTINGGKVYAYNHSAYTNEHKKFIPCVAIGGGSGVEENATEADVTINGGYVYAQSAGGVAIGGGGCSQSDGGKGTVTITGGEVHAKSMAGTIGTHPYEAGISIGGGTGNAKGGDAQITISGANTKLLAGSVGGGMFTKSGGKFGMANVSITGGDIRAQFIMQSTSSTATNHCSFDMTGGTIHDSSSESTDYIISKTDGAALWINDSKGVVNVTDATIHDCTAQNGGAIYMNGGKLTISGATRIHNNKALQNGGAAYINGGTTEFITTTAYVESNEAVMGGGLFVNGGTITFKGNIINNTAVNGGGVCLGPEASMTFKGGLITGNEAKCVDTEFATSAYHGLLPNIKGFGGGIYMQNGSATKATKLEFKFDDASEKTFGLYSNTAKNAGSEIVSEGGNTNVILPKISEMQLIGFEGLDSNPSWYQDYLKDDSGYYEEGGHAVEGSVQHVDRFKNIISEHAAEYVEHRIPDTRLSAIYSNYLCLTLSYNMLDITIKAKGLKGHETALFQLVRHGTENKYYDVLLTDPVDETASRVLKNMPWGTYSVYPVGAWNYAYDELDPKENLRLGETSEYEILYEMKHKSVARMPQHDERQPVSATD